MNNIDYSQRFDTRKSILRPWDAPGGKSFLLRILLWGAALYLLVFFFFGRGFLEAYMDMVRGLAELESLDESEVGAESLALFKFYASLFLVSIGGWFIAVSVETALHKNIFRGEDRGLFPLWFGRDEGRVMLTQFVLFLSIMGIYFAMIIGLVLLGFIGAALGSAGTVLSILLIIVGVFVGLAVIIKLMIRLAPAAAYGVKHDKLVIFEMWGKSKGNGWNIFGSYVITFLCGYLFVTVLMYLGLFISFGSAGIELISGTIPENPDEVFDSIAEIFSKTSVKISLGIFMIIYMAGNLLWYLHMWGVGNYAAEYISEREVSAGEAG